MRVQWELRARAVERGMRTSAEVRRRLAAAGLRISVGKMSAWWSTTPVSVRLDDLEVLCVVLGCEPSDLLVCRPPVPPAVSLPGMTSAPPAVSPPGMPPSPSTGPGLDAAPAPRPVLRRLVPPL